jgi:isopentenyl-diphosphate Delta-isomerase
MAERLDILDESGKKIGISKTKKEAHLLGLWHQAAHVWIYNSKGEVLLQKRSMDKDSHPGLWDVSAAGHVSAGESPKKAALRELYEEIGIKAKSKDLKKIFVRKKSISYPKLNWYNNEFDYVYLFKLNKLPTKLQKEEVEAIKFVPIDIFEKELRRVKTVKNMYLMAIIILK